MTQWIEPIYDRLYSDVLEAEENPKMKNPKGCYNAADLNRIENNTKYVAEDMLKRKIIRVPPALAIKTNWEQSDIPTREDMSRIVHNVQLLMSLSNPIIEDDLLVITESTQWTYASANAIEQNLNTMKNQPELPVQKFLLEIENGTIVEYGSNKAEIEENEVVTIKGVATGPDAVYMIFTHWSGNSDDLQYVENVDAQTTKFTGQYHDVTLTANFKTRFPRTLTLHGGRIYDDIGGTTRQFFAGDEILLLADTASFGKRFYEWLGTQAGIDNLTGGPEPSTSWLTMPDCDVDLTSKYINAGQHSVRVDGTLQGWYEYDDYVYISPSPRGSKYTFAYWSGNGTSYLESPSSSSFRMPDVNIEFTSVWTYNYSYNTVDVINGTINGQSRGENLREDSGQSISAATPPDGKEFSHWSLEGLGSFSNPNSANTTFYVGDGNAIITANYKNIPPSHIVTVENEGNSGGTRSFSVREGSTFSISTTEVLSDYMFDHWDRNGTRYGSSTYYSFTMGTSDVTFKAYYRDRKSYSLTVNNGSGSGTYKERQSVSIVANSPVTGYRFSNWSGNYHSIGNRYNSSTSITMPSSDCTVTANYSEDPTYHDVIVNNGSGSGRYYEGQYITCTGNQAPATYEFSHWTENDEIISYANPYRFYLGNSDRTLTAVYKPIPYFDVTVINGTGSGRYIRNSNPTIVMNPAPEGMKFLQWEILEGDQNDVYQPLAENTYIRNLTHNVTVKATYYVPDPEIEYTLTVTRKEGEIETSNHHVGDQVHIYADYPDEGYKFFKWTGDVQYLIDKYAEQTVVNMPAKNITLGMEYRREGFVTTYHVILKGGELLVESDPETGYEKWDIEGEFEERAVVPIRAIDIPPGFRFKAWENTEDGGLSVSTVADLKEPETTITVEDFDIMLTRGVTERDKHSLTVVNGETSGSYHEEDPASVFFNLVNTDTIHYEFTRWSGSDLAYVKLFDGGSFDIYKSGTILEPGDDPQIIRIPTRDITITANYLTKYRLKIQNGHNEEGEVEEFYTDGTEVKIYADDPEEGSRFSHWEGDIENIDNPYNPTINVTIPKEPISLKAVYVLKNNQNDIGLVNQNLYEKDVITVPEVELISGELVPGCLIADENGHLYIATEIVEDTISILRLTLKEGGKENGE